MSSQRNPYRESKTFTGRLTNGLRVVLVPTASRVAWLGIAVDAGTRDEGGNEHGLAHFVEHTIFKGTGHRRACHINSRMESVGGELNAYTTKETTMLYSVFPEQHLERALDLLADLVRDSRFPERELDLEREVVLEEVAGYLDTPAEAVYDDFEDLLFAGSDLGHNILGDEQCLRRMGSDDCRRFLDTYYTPERMTLYCLGNYDGERFGRLAERYIGSLRRGGDGARQRVRPQPVIGERRERRLDLHQSHTIVGAVIGGMFSDDRYAMALLNNILGGPGMNSLFNVELRERRGLVYSVESSLTAYTDCGAWMTYLGCERNRLDKALQIMRRVVTQMAEHPLSERRLEAYKRQYCGQMLVATDNAEAMALSAGRAMLYYNEVTTLADTIDRVNALTPAHLQEAAAALANPTILTLA